MSNEQFLKTNFNNNTKYNGRVDIISEHPPRYQQIIILFIVP